MHHFLVLVSASVDPLDPAVERYLADEECPSPTLVTEAHARWRARSVAPVMFASWRAGEPGAPVVVTDDGGLRAIAGRPVVVGPGDDSGFLVPGRLAPPARLSTELTDRLEGPCALVTIDPDGSGVIVGDAFGLHPLYIGSAGAVTVIANRPLLVAETLARAAGRPLQPDEEGLHWILLNGHMLGDDTGYRGVRRVPFGEAVRLAAGTAPRTAPWHAIPWVDGSPRAVPISVAIDGIEARMSATIRAVAGAGVPVTSELTAGRDSRLVLDLLARAGLAHDVGFCTYPGQASPDRDVAASIADRLGLRHEFRLAPTRPSGPFLESYVAHTRNVAGQLSCWESSTPPEIADLVLSGLTGESLRTNFPGKAGLRSAAEATSAFERHRFGRHRYVRAPVVDEMYARARALFVAPLEVGARPEDLFDVFYVQHRLRRWIGDKPDRFEQCFLPLYCPAAFRVVLDAGWEVRTSGALHDAIGARAGLRLDDVAFQRGTSWRSRAVDEPGYVRPAAAAADAGAGGFDRQAGDAVRRDAIRAAVEHDRDNAAFELVDREVVLTDLDRYAELERRDRIELHQALTVILWLGLARPDGTRPSDGSR